MEIKIKNFLAGAFIGIANIIPGVSGGTIIIMLGMFDKLMYAISDVFKKNATNRKKNLIFLSQILIGLLMGIIIFANIIDILLNNWPTQTLFAFIGLILFSIPYIVRKEIPESGGKLISVRIPFIKNRKPKARISLSFLVVGLLIIISLVSLDDNGSTNIVSSFPTITALYLVKMVVLGLITGVTTIFPGISGAMVLLIIGEYYIYKSYIAKALTFNPEIIIPLFFIGIGIIAGIVFSAKIVAWLLDNYRKETISLILGLIIMSSLTLIPTNIIYDVRLFTSSLIAFLVGGLVITGIEKSR